MNNLHCYKSSKCIVFLSHICPCGLIKQTVSLYGLVYIHHKTLATAKSKKIDFDIGELFSCASGCKGRATQLFNLA